MNSEVPDPLEAKIKAMKLPGIRAPWRDQLIFAAGQASVQQHSRPWMGAGCLVLGLLGGVFMGRLPLQNNVQENPSRMIFTMAPDQLEQIQSLPSGPDLVFHEPRHVVVEVTEEARRAWHDRELVLRLGVDALSSPIALISASETMSVGDMMKQEARR